MNIVYEMINGKEAIEEGLKLGKECFGPRFQINSHQYDEHRQAIMTVCYDIDTDASKIVAGRLAFIRDRVREGGRKSHFIYAGMTVPSYQGKGIAREMALWARMYMFKTQGITLSEGFLHPTNGAAAQLGLNHLHYVITQYYKLKHVAVVEWDGIAEESPSRQKVREEVILGLHRGEVFLLDGKERVKKQDVVDNEIINQLNNGLIGLGFDRERQCFLFN